MRNDTPAATNYADSQSATITHPNTGFGRFTHSKIPRINNTFNRHFPFQLNVTIIEKWRKKDTINSKET